MQNVNDALQGELPLLRGGLSAEPEQLSAEEEVAARYVHPEALALFAKCPCLRNVPVFSQSCEGFGLKCVASLGLAYFFSKGIANNLLTNARYPMFRDRFGIDGTRLQRVASISKMGWSIKPFTAVLTDCFPLFGFTKRWYLAGSCVLGAAVCLGYALLPSNPSSADIGAGFVFLTGYAIANIDILTEGHYSRLMRKNPPAGPALVSWIWWFIMGAGIIAAAIQGPLSDHSLPHVGVLIAAASQLVVTFFFIFNWYGELTNREERTADARVLHEELLRLRETEQEALETPCAPTKDLHPEESSERGEPLEDNAQASLDDALTEIGESPELKVVCGECIDDFEPPKIRSCLCGAVEFNEEVCVRNWRVLIYSGVMTAGVIAMTLVTIMGSTWDLLYACVAVAAVCIAMAFWALPLVIAKANVFIYFTMLLYLQISGPLDSFYLASPECIVDGPHFTYTFYNTIASIIGNVGGICGVTAFTYIFSRRGYRLTFIVTNFVQILASLFDIVMVKRWNVAIGIPDHAMYILGDAVVYEVCYMLSWMPMVVLISRICPRGSESMVYSIIAGFANLGQSMSATIGALLLELVWPVNTTKGSCDFHNLPMLLLVGHILLPLLIVPLSLLLLPSARVCDDIDVDGKVIQRDAKKRLAKDKAARAEEAHSSSSEPFDETRANLDATPREAPTAAAKHA